MHLISGPRAASRSAPHTPPCRDRQEAPPPTLGPARWPDVLPVFNLIQQGCLRGHFNPLYLTPRYQAGLGLQLFDIVLRGRLRLPDGPRCAAQLHVLRGSGPAVLGFCIVLGPAAGQEPTAHQLYMCAVADDQQARGLGRQLLQAVLAQWPPDTAWQADCLPASLAMRRLLHSQGFKPQADGGRPAAAQRWQRQGLPRQDQRLSARRAQTLRSADPSESWPLR